MRWFALVLLVGCYTPAPPAGAPCTGDGTCPAPLVCSPATHTCEASATATDAAIDVAIDAPAGDGPPGDLDGDGVPNLDDDCPTVADPDQHDEDADGVGNACDNCPATPNASQDNADQDGVGDACDPEPSAPDHIALFEGFDAPLTSWLLDADVTVSGGKLHVTSFEGALAPITSANGWVATHYRIESLRTGSSITYRSVELVSQVTDAGAGGYRCAVFDDPSDPGHRHAELQMFVDPYDIAGGAADGQNHAVADTGNLWLAYSAQDLECKTTLPVDDLTAAAPEARTGAPGVYTQNLGAAFDYIVVYEPGP